MRGAAAGLALALLLAGCGPPPIGGQGSGGEHAPGALAAQDVRLRAADGMAVFGRWYPVAHPRALILLFHQAGASSGEYATIAPQLNRAGYAALAIDQRSGGDRFGPNRTVAALGRSTDYLAALPDLQAALDRAAAMRLPVVAWGSSYSAALVFALAAGNPGRVAAVVAFSPGEYVAGRPRFVRDAAARVRVPVFVTGAPDPAEVAAARAIAAAVPDGRAEQYVPATGVHGSATLIATHDPAGADANWHAVEAFLARAVPGNGAQD